MQNLGISEPPTSEHLKPNPKESNDFMMACDEEHQIRQPPTRCHATAKPPKYKESKEQNTTT